MSAVIPTKIPTKIRPQKRKLAATADVREGVADTGKRLKLAELLLSVSHRLACCDTLDEILHALIEMVTAELNVGRSTLFLNDSRTNELYSRVAQGNFNREIRLVNSTGVAGHVFTTGKALTVNDPYNDPHFNRSIDDQTGFVTENILCVPICTAKGAVIGVAQALNKHKGRFNQADLTLLEAIVSQGTVALQSAQFIEQMKAVRTQEMAFLQLVSDVTADIKLGSLLQKVMGEATRMLNAERSTLFLNDDKTQELWSEIGQGLEAMQIRFPNSLGIAGAVFNSGQTINIPYAYADLRFNPAFDRKTGFFTRSILSVPVVNKQGRIIGVTQVLNKRGGPFKDDDEARLKAFTAQVSIALENAKLFADVQAIKNYNESMLQSMPSGVLTLDESEKIVTCNAAGLRILQLAESSVLHRPAEEVFAGRNHWVLEKSRRVVEAMVADVSIDAELDFGGEAISANVSIQPLVDEACKRLGCIVMIDDISKEKRLKSTMSRYMDPSIADKLLEKGTDVLGGQSVEATILFSDIRGFTTLTEQLGAQGTVSLLNEYFELMVECITAEGGMLDKFIGDAIMAGFGIPVPHDDDEDRAVRAALAMLRALDAWNRQRASEGRGPVNIGIGINTDTVVSGNIGSKRRMDFTVIGDGVNLAARLESACKQYHARLLVSENTFRKLRGTFRAREIDLVVVKGKTQPVAVFELLDYHTDDSFPNLMDVLNHFKDGIEKYRKRRFEPAIDAFRRALELNPKDALCDVYIERAEHLIANPPDTSWDGTWTMASK